MHARVVFLLGVAALCLFALTGTALATAPVITSAVRIYTPEQPGDAYVDVGFNCVTNDPSTPGWYTHLEVVLRDAISGIELGTVSGNYGDVTSRVPVTDECYERWMSATVTISNPDGSDSATGDNLPPAPPTVTNVDMRWAEGLGYVGQEMMLGGTNLGFFHTAPSKFVFEPGGLEPEILHWGPDDITFKVPKGAKTGTIHVTTPKGTSNDFPFKVIDSVAGYVFDGHGQYAEENAVQDAKVELIDKASDEVLDSDHTDEEGAFGLSCALEADKEYRVKVTLESKDELLAMQRDGDTVTFSRDFTPQSSAVPDLRIDCSKTDKIAEASMAKDDVDNCASVWHWLQLNRQAAQDLGYDLNATLTVNAFASDSDGTIAFYRQAENAIYLGSHVMDDDTHAASATTGAPDDADPAPWNFAKNRESHEFGHALTNVIMNGSWPSRNRVQNHAGYVNADTGDSLAEGFAEFWTMVADDEQAMDADSDLYDAWGHLATTNRRMAWYPVKTASPMTATTATTDYPGEEFAVAGLLRNLQAALGGGRTGFAMIAANLPSGGTLTDLHDNLVTAGASAATIDPLFFRYGFFADNNGNWTHDAGEVVGAGNGAQCRMRYDAGVGDVVVAARPDRRDHPYEPNAFVAVDLKGIRAADRESWVTVTVKHDGDPSADYSRRLLMTGSSGLVYLSLDDGASSAVLAATGSDGVASADKLTITSADWSAARAAVAAGAALTTTFHVNRVTVGNPVAPRTAKARKAIAVTCTLQPRHTAGTWPVCIYKYRLVSGKWKACGFVKAKAADSSTFTRCSCKVKLPFKGKWRLRAQAVADADHAATWSRGYALVTVR